MQLFSVHKNPRLLITLLTALAQGFLLGWLHTAVREEYWPSTSPQWLVALYAVSAFVPLTIQLMSEHWRTAKLWIVVAVMGILFFYFGWHFGTDVLIVKDGVTLEEADAFIFFCVLSVLWLHFLPFLRARLATGRWHCEYTELFAAAWQQAIMLAEAALFTGLFWALLMLWAVLFKMLGYEFFRWFFTDPAFAYPFTAVAFGLALYLTGSLDRLVTVVREQLLGLLKWLAPVAGLILVLFAPTLLVKLPDLIVQGERAISAAWLLWLLAFTVLLLNAGYQNGRIEQPYPKPIAMFLRIATPATVIVAATALYALFVRISEYGITVDRVFAVIVALVGVVYSVGYTVAAFRRGPWLQGIERVNVALAIGIIVVLGLTLTPIASPYRLSASSQYAQAIATEGKKRRSALTYLRFNSGAYGQHALERLTKLEGTDKHAEEIRRQAKSMLQRKSRWDESEGVDIEAALAGLSVYPAGRRIPAELMQVLRSDFGSEFYRKTRNFNGDNPLALFVDLNADSIEECVIVTYPYYTLYTLRDKGWISVNGRTPAASSLAQDDLQKALAAGDFSALPRQWQDLRIGKNRVHLENPIFAPQKAGVGVDTP